MPRKPAPKPNFPSIKSKQIFPAPIRTFDIHTVESQDDGNALADIISPQEVQVAFRAVYSQVRAAKLDEKKVHMMIAGGRRTLTVAGMAVAQMLFDDEDRLWHLASHPALEASGAVDPGGDSVTQVILTWLVNDACEAHFRVCSYGTRTRSKIASTSSGGALTFSTVSTR